MIGILASLAFSAAIACSMDEPPGAAGYESDIRAFEAEDRADPPAPGGLVFLGSSTIRLWDLAASFPDLPAVNRGFGGSRMDQAAYFADRILKAREPRVVVIYEGDNDVAAGHTPEQVAEDFKALLAAIRRHAPSARVLYLGIKPSVDRWEMYPKMSQANRLVGEIAAQDGNARLVDLGPLLLDAEGHPRLEMFQDDGLHLSAEGYRVWSEGLRPLLDAP